MSLKYRFANILNGDKPQSDSALVIASDEPAAAFLPRPHLLDGCRKYLHVLWTVHKAPECIVLAFADCSVQIQHQQRDTLLGGIAAMHAQHGIPFSHHANRRGKIFVLGNSAGKPNLRCTPRHKSNSDPYTLANARLPLAIDTRASAGISSS